MVCPLHKRVLSAVFASLLLAGTGYGDFALAKDTYRGGSTVAQTDNLLGVVSVRLNPDGSGLSLETTRPFTVNDTRHLSVLKFPSPYRLMVEIPNARLAGTQTVFPINQNGIDRVELSENSSTFYQSVRALIYVNDGQTLARLTTTFDGNVLKVDGLPAVATAMTPEQISDAANSAKAPKVASRAVRMQSKAKPLPPEVKPIPAMLALQPKPAPLPVVAQAPVGGGFGAAPQTVLSTPVAAGTSIIQNVYYRDNRLYLQANPGAELRIKNRFQLTGPNRLVLDVANAVLSNRSLMAPIMPGSDDVRQIRVGQFDENTVRIVIEAPAPDQFEAIYSGGERNLLSISPYAATSVTKLSANTRLGQVESIDLKRDSSGNTVLHLEASTPIVHRFTKKDDRVIVDLLNEAANPSNINVDSRAYPEIEKMRLEPLTEGQPNSKLAITLTNPNVRVTPSVSPDGRVLELAMTTVRDSSMDAGNTITNLGDLAAAGNAPFPARIVLDAGHGGKDLGANRNGVNEKDLNLSLALMVRDALTAKGFKVYMTRSTDVFLPLPQISAITNDIRPDLFISIHHNASVNPALNGIETYYYSPQSLALARRVQTRAINNVSARDGGVKRAMFYVIHHTSVPAILCEVGYVSNPDELDDLQTYERKQKTARAIADGVVDYLKASLSARANPKRN